MPKSWLIGGGVFLGLLVIASIIVTVTEQEKVLPEGSPEAVVQRYLKAVETESFELAHGLLSDELKAECPVEDFFADTGPRGTRFGDDRVTLEATATVGDSVRVTVRITSLHRDGLVGTSESMFEQTFTLRREDSEWRFKDYPWPFFSRCGPFKPVDPQPVERPTPIPRPAPRPSPLPATAP